MTTNYWLQHYPYITNNVKWRDDIWTAQTKNLNISRIFEIGTGLGNNLHAIKQLHPNAYFAGVELNQAAIDAGTNLHYPTSNIKQANLYDPRALESIPDNHYDFVFSSGVLIYFTLTDVIRITQQLQRISSHYVYHIELHGNQGIHQVHTDVVMYVHDFNTLYNKPNIIPLKSLSNKAEGEAKHLIQVTL